MSPCVCDLHILTYQISSKSNYPAQLWRHIDFSRCRPPRPKSISGACLVTELKCRWYNSVYGRVITTSGLQSDHMPHFGIPTFNQIYRNLIFIFLYTCIKIVRIRMNPFISVTVGLSHISSPTANCTASKWSKVKATVKLPVSKTELCVCGLWTMTHLLFCFTVWQQNKPIVNERCRYVRLHEIVSWNALKQIGVRRAIKCSRRTPLSDQSARAIDRS